MEAKHCRVPWNAGMSNGWTDKRGYRWLYVTENGRRRARREHRVIMERHLNRRLEPWEIVHHKDGNTSNNCIDNLEVMEFGKHSIAHHANIRKDKDAKRSMEAFALMREELNSERRNRISLIGAAEKALERLLIVERQYEREGTLGYLKDAIAKAKGEA